MYLAEIEIENYRCLKKITVKCQAGVNVIVGENNSGKTALMDALRLISSLGTGRRDIYASEDDLWHDENGKVPNEFFEICATFKELNEGERGLYSLCLCPSLGEGIARIHMRFEMSKVKSRKRPRTIVWGGETRGEGIDFEILDGIRATFLGALRDAQADLRPGKRSRVSRLIDLLSEGDSEKAELERIVEEAQKNILKGEVVKRAKDAINERLIGLTGEFLAQEADLKFSPAEFRKIAESIQALVGKGRPFELEENGLGYNNILYIATVMGELQKAKAADEIDLAMLLIEEPEAHLHPHMQTVLMDYLEGLTPSEVGEKKSEDDEGKDGDLQGGNSENGEKKDADEENSGTPVQVFISSHSPVLAARAKLKSINVLYCDERKELVAYPVAKCPLNDKERKYLRRFLDATKAQLFFTRGVIFVEGISEALLVPEIARLLGTPYPLDKLGITIVNVQSLGFNNFVKLFGEGQLGIPVVIISDSDPPKEKGTEFFPESFETDKKSNTAENLMKLKSDNFKVCLAAKTLEYDLALAGNAPLMAEVYEGIRPEKGKKMQTEVGKYSSCHEQAKAFWENFDKKDKAKFAQELAFHLGDKRPEFTSPPHIKKAVDWIKQKINARQNRENS